MVKILDNANLRVVLWVLVPTLVAGLIFGIIFFISQYIMSGSSIQKAILLNPSSTPTTTQ